MCQSVCTWSIGQGESADWSKVCQPQSCSTGDHFTRPTQMMKHRRRYTRQIIPNMLAIFQWWYCKPNKISITKGLDYCVNTLLFQHLQTPSQHLFSYMNESQGYWGTERLCCWTAHNESAEVPEEAVGVSMVSMEAVFSPLALLCQFSWITRGGDPIV